MIFFWEFCFEYKCCKLSFSYFFFFCKLFQLLHLELEDFKCIFYHQVYFSNNSFCFKVCFKGLKLKKLAKEKSQNRHHLLPAKDVPNHLKDHLIENRLKDHLENRQNEGIDHAHAQRIALHAKIAHDHTQKKRKSGSSSKDHVQDQLIAITVAKGHAQNQLIAISVVNDHAQDQLIAIIGTKGHARGPKAGKDHAAKNVHVRDHRKDLDDRDHQKDSDDRDYRKDLVDDRDHQKELVRDHRKDLLDDRDHLGIIEEFHHALPEDLLHHMIVKRVPKTQVWKVNLILIVDK